ncbi:alpha/beta fold hydrolase [Roseateles sp. LKC17W]|uniref:Alpha/beta fold hydrolase n=1 Tax=Pelomonas margarita TaxID=3299031 RepID=A0ABW7FJM4_9BURK
MSHRCLSLCVALLASVMCKLAMAQAASPFAGARFTQVIGGGGVPLNVVDKGDPAKPAVLFIHGFRQSYLSWTLQFGSDLASRCRLVAFDLRGHGNSGHPWQSEAYDNAKPWADDVASVIQALGLRKPLIVAWSFGGNVAMDFASLQPAVPVAGYLLTGTAAGTLAVPPPPANAPPRPAASPDLALNIGALDASMKLLFPSPAMDPALRAQFAAAAMRVGPWVDQAVARRARSAATLPAQPAVFATGGKDPLVGPATVARLKDFFPQARFVDFADAGHAVFIDEPARFNALIDEIQCQRP